MSISTAFRAFFVALGSGEKSRRIADILDGKTPETPVIAEEKPAPAPAVKKDSRRHEALTLLAAFQREARFLDFLQEDLTSYADAQIGAAARDIHRQCGEVVARMFAPAPLVAAEENAAIPLPEKIDPAVYNLTGTSASPPTRGTLIHHGWRATKCDIPQWSGTSENAEILAPAEVEV